MAALWVVVETRVVAALSDQAALWALAEQVALGGRTVQAAQAARVV